MFTSEAQSIIELGKNIALTRRESKLEVEAIATALAMNPRGATFLAGCLELDAAALRGRFPGVDKLQRCSGKLPLADDCREMLRRARLLVEKVPAGNQAALIALPHLACAVALSLAPGPGDATHEEKILRLLAQWVEEDSRPPSLGVLTQRLRALRQHLLARISGQDDAVHQFVEGLFGVEVVAAADTSRRKPAGLFVFAGPPGVGKTYLAELGSSNLNRPFKRFDMSGYSLSHETTSLVGSPRFYKDSQPGALTNFVQRNPDAVLLFDEIEKAHSTAIQLFLQVLDAGRLQDKYSEENVEFRNTIVIFTTNVGRQLYENENAAGVHQANAAFHRGTILDALRSDIDPRTQAPFFPAAICSRMATGYPILFNRLRVDDLARIAGEELVRVASLLERQHGPRFVFGDEIPLALVMREGANTDARTIKAQTEAFLKDEVFKSCQLFSDDHVDQVFRAIQTVTVQIDRQNAGEHADRLFWEKRRPVVLFVGDPFVARFHAQLVDQVEWCAASNADQVFDILAKRGVDLVVLDLALRQEKFSGDYDQLADAFGDLSSMPGNGTELYFDHTPLAARRFAAGQQLLSNLHARMPDAGLPLLCRPRGQAFGCLRGRGTDRRLRARRRRARRHPLGARRLRSGDHRALQTGSRCRDSANSHALAPRESRTRAGRQEPGHCLRHRSGPWRRGQPPADPLPQLPPDSGRSQCRYGRTGLGHGASAGPLRGGHRRRGRQGIPGFHP
ncbi:MAG: AAA family ATPase [Candidatus Accumulibacter sp.]|nr:AAA family ATPase [Accumulibacter sp.]